ncbi:carboxylating nicotinate-nucleotide diphosphorylase [Myxosarcina sp. GI1]|uniref:carboxylating nicotinate-nucleotide diphosphorylase n=1 Tax=Myxosarcina sp. GI1 TaxID=1541065 RepID=UPI00056CBC0E|nr:carboxylating nicotinate-nucleotide diphosphorylase [Myxosarcina sp. GI1]
MKNSTAVLPSFLLLDRTLEDWLREDIGRGDRTTQSLLNSNENRQAYWIAKEAGIIAGLPIAARVFQILDKDIKFKPLVAEGQYCDRQQKLAIIEGSLAGLLMGERVAINLAMSLSGIATLTNKFVTEIEDLPTQLADTRKTTPGLRILEKYATQVGGAINQRMGLDDGVMIKDNHIVAAGGIAQAIAQIRPRVPYSLKIEVETETLAQVEEALEHGADLIMLDNMTVEMMQQSVRLIKQKSDRVKSEASGNITLDNIRDVAETGVDYISSSAPITRSSWLDLSMKMVAS